MRNYARPPGSAPNAVASILSFSRPAPIQARRSEAQRRNVRRGRFLFLSPPNDEYTDLLFGQDIISGL